MRVGVIDCGTDTVRLLTEVVSVGGGRWEWDKIDSGSVLGVFGCPILHLASTLSHNLRMTPVPGVLAGRREFV